LGSETRRGDLRRPGGRIYLDGVLDSVTPAQRRAYRHIKAGQTGVGLTSLLATGWPSTPIPSTSRREDSDVQGRSTRWPSTHRALCGQVHAHYQSQFAEAHHSNRGQGRLR
jgi:hypothetical protein